MGLNEIVGGTTNRGRLADVRASDTQGKREGDRARARTTHATATATTSAPTATPRGRGGFGRRSRSRAMARRPRPGCPERSPGRDRSSVAPSRHDDTGCYLDRASGRVADKGGKSNASRTATIPPARVRASGFDGYSASSPDKGAISRRISRSLVAGHIAIPNLIAIFARCVRSDLVSKCVHVLRGHGQMAFETMAVVSRAWFTFGGS